MVDRIAVYPGSFDPWTVGHTDILERALRIFPEVVVALGVHPTRQPLFSVEERLQLLNEVCAPWSGVRVGSFDGLLVDFARSVGATAIVRGLRSGSDFDYEINMAAANADLYPELDTVFLPARAGQQFVSASLVREVARHGGDVSRYTPSVIRDALRRKLGT
jgi:pantetheine-phosphate adenylyltransferase